MTTSLANAVTLAESVRYSKERRRSFARDGRLEAGRIHYQFNERGLKLSPSMTPDLYKVLENVCTRLKIKPNDVLAYVHESPTIQAGCYCADTQDCLISISSGLVNLMAEDELAFVIGHELGHFLLGHGEDRSGNDESIEGLMQSRYREISADRIGMLACSSQEAAFSALIKTTAGLDERHIRFDISAYLDQLRGAMNPGSHADGTTHPSLVMRCRALLWFCMSHEYKTQAGDSAGESIVRIDERIAQDLEKNIDGPANRRISDANETFRIWMMVVAAARDGTFNKKEQAIIAEGFGNEVLEKILNLISGYGKEEAISVVRGKLISAMDFYRSIAPNHYASEKKKIEALIAKQFSQGDFPDFIDKFLNQRNHS